jgi:hypothetical protein
MVVMVLEAMLKVVMMVLVVLTMMIYTSDYQSLARTVQSVLRLAAGSTVQGSNPGGARISAPV